MRRGEIRWYKFPQPDKKRPVLILTRNSVIEYINEVTVAPVTSTRWEIPSEVFIGPTDGMSRECAVNCDHLQTVAKAKIGPLITVLSSEKMDAVKDALRFSLGM
jgi:mRNA interferase MazF